MNQLTGLVTGPTLLSYIEVPSLQDHNDIADCNNIATRSADLGHHRYADPKGWFEEYARTLNFLGWSLYGDTLHTRTQHIVSGSVADFLVESAQAMRDSRQANAMIDTLDTLKTNNPAMLSLDKETREGETFQIIPARYDLQGNLNIALYKLELSVDIRRRSFLFWNWEKRSASIVQRKAFLKLNRRELDSKRMLIKKKLDEHLMKRFALRKGIVS
ncbi:hypothetical protein [Pseudomonas thivervalensis]|jgi:hypothetical protein|uniref:hypothetical protein n=1 Tax=Pseudomonas thivervalensis TaxID=86265 RepID=UPI00069D0B21|nr:hypothetical protein [Pseudomonas thivervalensis]OAB52778.1 hypothetical protein APS14_02475 [Pseudomonas thivervalensis]SDG19894.1 hypothetical protein SAMN04490204_3371 [Pseudomonas thivervalensis]